MADESFHNVVNGELVDAISGETYDVIDPTTGEVYAHRPHVGRRGRRPGLRRRGDGIRDLGRLHPAGPRLRAAEDRRRDRGPRRTSINAVECKDTGKPLHLTLSEELPYASDHFRFFAGAARVLEGRSAGEYMADHTSWIRREPIGRRRPGHALELPADDDDLEDRPGAGRGQHDRPQAQ